MAHIGSLEVALLTQMPGADPVQIGIIEIPIDSGLITYGSSDLRVNRAELNRSLADALEFAATQLRLT